MYIQSKIETTYNTIFNRAVTNTTNAFKMSDKKITVEYLFGNKNYGSRTKPDDTGFQYILVQFKKKTNNLKIYENHLIACENLYLDILNERKIYNLDDLNKFPTAQRKFEVLTKAFNKIEAMLSQLSVDSQGLFCTDLTNEDANTVRNFFVLALEEAYYIVRLLEELNAASKKKRPNLLNKIAESTQTAETENLVKGKLTNGKCFINFSNEKPWDKRYDYPVNILYFALIFNDHYWAGHRYSYSYTTYDEYTSIHKDDSTTCERYHVMHKLVNYHLNNSNSRATRRPVVCHNFNDRSLEKTLASILGYISDIVDEKKIDEYLNYIPDAVLPDKIGFKSFLKSIEALDDVSKTNAIYSACVDKSLLTKYIKSTRDFWQIILRDCNFSEAKQKVNSLKIISEQFYDLDSKIVYDYVDYILDSIQEKQFEFLKKYGLSPFVFYKDWVTDSNISFIFNVHHFIYAISKNVKSKSEAIDYALFLVKSFTASNFQDGIDLAEYAVYELSEYDEKDYNELIEREAFSEFDNICWDVFVEIISENRENSRTDAIKVSKYKLTKAVADGTDKEAIEIFKRVIHDFKEISDEAYEELKHIIS